MKHSRRNTLVAAATVVTVTGITVASVVAAVGSYASTNATKVLDVRTDVRDLQPGSPGPLDHARARVELLRGSREEHGLEDSTGEQAHRWREQ